MLSCRRSQRTFKCPIETVDGRWRGMKVSMNNQVICTQEKKDILRVLVSSPIETVDGRWRQENTNTPIVPY